MPKFPTGPGYQTRFAERVRKESEIATGTVGMITEPAQAEHILRTGQADIIFLARELLRDLVLRRCTADDDLGGSKAVWPRNTSASPPRSADSRVRPARLKASLHCHALAKAAEASPLLRR